MMTYLEKMLRGWLLVEGWLRERTGLGRGTERRDVGRL